MTDNEMMISLIAEIERQFDLVGVTDYEVGRNQQPTNQYTGGSDDDPVKTRVFLFAITNPSQGKSWRYRSGAQFERSDTQHKAKGIQVSVAHSFNEEDIDARTPEDMTNLIHDLLDSPDSTAALREKDIFVQEVGDVRPVFFTNDKDRFESLPNFDLQVNYSSSITKVAGFVDVADCLIEGV